MESGDFSTLAEAYAKYRPGYSPVVLRNLLAVIKPTNVVDIGAGTGIWTRMLSQAELRVSAVEPNDKMREEGEKYTKDTPIVWRKGSAESTQMEVGCTDWVTMASSFHWANVEDALREFSRILKPKGWVTVLWNPRDIEASSLHQRIEALLYQIVPELERVSSGSSKHVRDYTRELTSTGVFRDAFLLEAPHEIEMSVSRYIGAWRSVNDVQRQAGPERFERFLHQVAEMLADSDTIVVPYKTRAWTVQKIG